MIDKIIKLSNGIEYYVVDEVFKNDKIYLFLVQTSVENDLITDKCVVAEAKIVDGKIVIDNIYDDQTQEEINNIIIERANKKMGEKSQV